MSAPEKPEMTAGEIRKLADNWQEIADLRSQAALSNRYVLVIIRALREYADRMERPEPSADEVKD